MISLRFGVVACGVFLAVGCNWCAGQSSPANGLAEDHASSSPTSQAPVATATSADGSQAPQNVDAPGNQPSPPPPSVPPSDHPKLGPIDLSVNWRMREEGWNWFEGNSGNSDYAFWHSQLRVGLGQNRERMEWLVEGDLVALDGLPDKAVVAAPQGQLGLGGNYYAANGNNTRTASGFLKQGFLTFKGLGPVTLKIGRFEYFDGLEVKPQDPFLAAIIQSRISSRLISNFGYSAVQRSFDGVQLSLNSGSNNFTFLGARPTQGVFQVQGMDELDVDTYYGAYTKSVHAGQSSGELRVFGLGYIDHRTLVLKTDNRPAPIRATDKGKIEIATWGADYAHVFTTSNAGNFDFLLWGAAQTGSWGNLTQRSGAFVGEAGWKPPLSVVKPWISAGYSWGSGDDNPNDSTHGTFFQVLTTPRQYARFPFYNMMNNEDVYGAVNANPTSKLALRTEVHALRLSKPADLWYTGGGAFQPKTFGFTGRPSNSLRGLANVWDISGDYKITRNFSTTLYYGHAWGKGVIAAIYPRDADGMLAYLETNVRF